MKQVDNKTGYFQRFQLFVMRSMAPSSLLEKDSLVYWRVRILFTILFTALLLGTIALVPAIAHAVKKEMWGLLVLDITVWLTSVFLLLSPSQPYTIRAGIGALILYFMGVFILISLGPLSGGPAWLFTFAVLVGIYFGSEIVISALILNAITLTTICWLIHAGVFGQGFPFFDSVEVMVTTGAIFMLLNATSAISVSVLVKGLVATHEKEKALIDTLEREQRHLNETKSKLEEEIEDRKQAEEALSESERLYRLLAENVTDIIWTMDMELNFTYFSPSVTRMRGYRVEEAMAQSVEESMTPESFEKAVKVITEELEMHNNGLKSKDRSRTIEAELTCKDGSTIWTEIEGNFLYDANGQPEGVIGVTRDITERKRTQRQLLRSEKLASLGDMVAGVAHEISTPLGVSVMSASYLNDATNELNQLSRSGKVESPEVEKYIKKATEASSLVLSNLARASDLLNSFKHVAFDQLVEERRKFNLRTNMEDTLKSLHPKYKRTEHTVSVECPEDLEINSYPGAFSQIITNLVVNSLNHGFEGIDKGKIVLTAEKKRDVLFFTYRDNGKGMSEKVLNKLFDPFFTTTRSKGGTGLGMYIVYNIVTQTLNGLIECKSALGRGAEYTIKIPLSY